MLGIYQVENISWGDFQEVFEQVYKVLTKSIFLHLSPEKEEKFAGIFLPFRRKWVNVRLSLRVQ